MSNRKSPSKFTRERGKLIQRAREEANMKPAELAAELGKSRPWVVGVEKGDIHDISERDCRVLIAVLGLNPSELTQDAHMLGEDILPGCSFRARRVARAFDELPKPLQDYLWGQIEAYQKLARQQPILAQIMGTPVPITQEPDR